MIDRWIELINRFNILWLPFLLNIFLLKHTLYFKHKESKYYVYHKRKMISYIGMASLLGMVTESNLKRYSFDFIRCMWLLQTSFLYGHAVRLIPFIEVTNIVPVC